MVKDPVCGMEVDEKTTGYKSIQGNNVYYFCSTPAKQNLTKTLRNICTKKV